VATSSDVEIATFTVTDADMVDITSGNENGHFYIMYDYVSTASLYVSASSPLDYESATSHTLTIEASDMAGSTVSGSLTVNVLDVAEAPTFTGGPFSFSIAEDAASGTLVGTVTATAPQNDLSMFSISGGDPSGDFSIVSTGQITVQGMLDYEITPSYTLSVEAMDMDGNSASTNVTITVTDVAEAPTFTASSDPDGYWFVASEAAQTGTSVGSVPVSDPQGDFLTITVYEGDVTDPATWQQSDGFFAYEDNGNALIEVNNQLDHESQADHHLILEADDGYGNTSTIGVEVAIQDELEWYSTGLFVVAWEVAASRYHTLVLIIPDDQPAWENDPNFSEVLYIGTDPYHFSTLSAFPHNFIPTDSSLLESRIAYDTGRIDEDVTGGVFEIGMIDICYCDQNTVISSSFSLDAAYADDLSYGLFPESAPPGTKYNSNSYVSGLLNALMDQNPGVSIFFDLSSVDDNNDGNLDYPGWGIPVPLSNFGL